MKNVWVIIAIVIAVILLSFGVNLLLTKGIILVADSLFKVDWHDKFWMVFVALIIIQSLIGCAKGRK